MGFDIMKSVSKAEKKVSDTIDNNINIGNKIKENE